MSFRRNWLTRPIFSSARRALPTMSDTEREALEAGGLLLEPSETRDRLTAGLYLGKHEEGLARLERAFALAIENEPIAKRLRDARIYDWRAAKKSGLITDIESERMAALEEAVAKVVAVDDFAADALSPTSKKPTLDNATLASRSTGAS
jgi:acyl-CoA dehydrogenase